MVHGDSFYYVEFDETSERIHAVAMSRPDDFASLLAGVADINENPAGQPSDDDHSQADE